MLYKFTREIDGTPLEFGLKAAVTNGTMAKLAEMAEKSKIGGAE